jgi:glycosyltransferase involved in cell wall biosynthesis
VPEKLVSIIMPAYNCERFVEKAIDSILKQTYSNFELLIADDASKDTTKKMIDTYQDSRIKLFHNEENLGYTQASNKLFALCKGDFITFQDADDYSELNRIKTLVDFLEANTEIACVGSNTAKVDENDQAFWWSDVPLEDKKIRDYFSRMQVVMTGSSLMVRRKVSDTLGLYHSYFNRIGSEDVYWYSLILSQYKVANLKEVLYYYRTNPNSVTSFFKNPKSNVLYNLIVMLYKRRAFNQTDFIANLQHRKADAACLFFIALDKVPGNKFVGFMRYIILSLQWPSLGYYFFRDFMYKLIKN